jgi:Rad52/22 family double-strand break repair protein
MTKTDEILFRLYAPFKQVYERKGPGGKVLKYITARMVMNRLTEILGPGNWWDEYEIFGDRVVCKLSIRVEDLTITRCDTGEAGQGEDLDGDKSIFSDAFKRAGVKFGIGLYLYNDRVPTEAMAYFENGHREYSNPSHSQSPNGSTPPKTGSWAPNYNCPRNGKSLYAWANERGKEFGVDGLNALKNDPEIKGIFPRFMGEWNEDMVKIGYEKLVAIWESNGVWPMSSSAEPKNTPAVNSAIQSPPNEEIESIKKALRNKIVELIMSETGMSETDVKYHIFLNRINKLGEANEIFVENWAVFRDKEKLIQLGSLAYEEFQRIQTDDVPF